MNKIERTRLQMKAAMQQKKQKKVQATQKAAIDLAAAPKVYAGSHNAVVVPDGAAPSDPPQPGRGERGAHQQRPAKPEKEDAGSVISDASSCMLIKKRPTSRRNNQKQRTVLSAAANKAKRGGRQTPAKPNIAVNVVHNAVSDDDSEDGDNLFQ